MNTTNERLKRGGCHLKYGGSGRRGRLAGLGTHFEDRADKIWAGFEVGGKVESRTTHGCEACG